MAACRIQFWDVKIILTQRTKLSKKKGKKCLQSYSPYLNSLFIQKGSEFLSFLNVHGLSYH